MDLETVIGLEVHVQLRTRSKLFCPCPASFAGDPNSRICPVCTGQPGALPVLNEEALALAIRAGLALGCTIRQRTKFDRKNYFYPDLPKGYQISQFDQPVAESGSIQFEVDGEMRTRGITRAHLEEDAGKTMHPEGQDHSLVDLNRAGIPLIEIVGEPDLTSPAEAKVYLQTLRRMMRYADVSDCDMEKGSMRCDANISLRPRGQKELGTKVEIKNMNSARNVERALEFEIQRQGALFEAGNADQIVQETRSFRDQDGSTTSMRQKEEADDYRYFPDPDLPVFTISEEQLGSIRETMPETYERRRDRFENEYGLSAYDAGVLTDDPKLAQFFSDCVAAGVEPKAAANWVQGELLAALGESGTSVDEIPTTPKQLAELVVMVADGALSHQAAKKVFREMLSQGTAAEETARALDLLQIQDTSVLEQTVDEVIARETKSVEDYRSGKQAALNALLGRVMRACQGKGNPQVIRELLVRKLG